MIAQPPSKEKSHTPALPHPNLAANLFSGSVRIGTPAHTASVPVVPPLYLSHKCYDADIDDYGKGDGDDVADYGDDADRVHGCSALTRVYRCNRQRQTAGCQ